MLHYHRNGNMKAFLNYPTKTSAWGLDLAQKCHTLMLNGSYGQWHINIRFRQAASLIFD